MLISKIMEQNRFKKVPYNKNFSIGVAINYNEECSCVLLLEKSFLNLETMDIIT